MPRQTRTQIISTTLKRTILAPKLSQRLFSREMNNDRVKISLYRLKILVKTIEFLHLTMDVISIFLKLLQNGFFNGVRVISRRFSLSPFAF
jgi:hypothetical protein